MSKKTSQSVPILKKIVRSGRNCSLAEYIQWFLQNTSFAMIAEASSKHLSEFDIYAAFFSAVKFVCGTNLSI
jgi:RAB protein geranylgeranyltransferase component A